ncbi:MAG: NAD(P)-dependent oxidoreductase [Acidobacteriota bacterium]
MNVGFVGLGNMGGAIARRIMSVRKLHVYDLRPAAVEDFARAGAAPTRSPGELAAACDLVLTCLPTSDEVHSVIFDDDGLLSGLGAGSVIADMTTGDPVATRKMAARLGAHKVHLIDAPVSCGPQGAEKGTLAIMVGAPKELYDRCFEVFAAVTPNIFHTGDVGSGHTMKLVNNVISACNRAIAFEAVTLAVKNGLDAKVCADILQKSSGRSYMTEITFPPPPGGPLRH